MVAVVPLLVVGGACDPEPTPLPPREVVSLVDPDGWEPVPADADVFAERIVPGGQCPAGEGHYPEDFAGQPSYKIDTTFCDGITLAQPTTVDLRPDEVVAIKIYHFSLVAPTPAVATLGLAVDGQRLWEHEVPIPSEASLIEAHAAVPAAIEAGAQLQLHLDNHGTNNWVLFRIERQPAVME